MVVDLFLVYQFIRRLATPFNKWEAYKLGIIDEKGKVLIKKKNFTTKAQSNAWGRFDILVANLKKLLAKVPGGSSRIASYAAALYLIREHKHFTEESTLNEDLSEQDIDNIVLEFHSRYNHYTMLVEDVNGLNEKAELFLEAKTPRWKRTGPSGEIEIEINGQKYKIEKSLDHNERHKGEFKIMVWNKRREEWEWDNTVRGKAYAKELVMDKMDEATNMRNLKLVNKIKKSGVVKSGSMKKEAVEPHPEVVKAYKKTQDAEHKDGEYGTTSTKRAVTRTANTLSKKIKQHHPDLDMKGKIALRTQLQNMKEGAFKRIAQVQSSKTDRMTSNDKKGLETYKKKPKVNTKPELEEEPANNVGSGNIAGMDGGHMSKAAQKKWTSKNKSKKKSFKDMMGEKDGS